MTKPQKIALVLLRITLGFLFLYAGIAKLIDPAWTSGGYLMGAQTLAGFYQWLASPENIAWVDMVNKWALFLIGATIIVGAFTRCASILASLLMALYYIPTLKFPYAGTHAYIIDEHIIYIAGFLVLIAFNAGIHWGIDGMVHRSRNASARLKKCSWCR